MPPPVLSAALTSATAVRRLTIRQTSSLQSVQPRQAFLHCLVMLAPLLTCSCRHGLFASVLQRVMLTRFLVLVACQAAPACCGTLASCGMPYRNTGVSRAGAEAKLAKLADEAAALEAEAARRQPAAAKLRRAVDARRAKSAGLQTRLHEIEDRIFETFSRKVPLPSAASACVRLVCHKSQVAVKSCILHCLSTK